MTKLVPFGVFVQVGDGIEGLVRLSESSSVPATAPQAVVQIGDQLTVVVTDIDWSDADGRSLGDRPEWLRFGPCPAMDTRIQAGPTGKKLLLLTVVNKERSGRTVPPFGACRRPRWSVCRARCPCRPVLSRGRCTAHPHVQDAR